MRGAWVPVQFQEVGWWSESGRQRCMRGGIGHQLDDQTERAYVGLSFLS